MKRTIKMEYGISVRIRSDITGDTAEGRFIRHEYHCGLGSPNGYTTAIVEVNGERESVPAQYVTAL